EHVGQRVDVGAEEVVAAGGLGGQRPRVGDAADLLEPVGDQRVGAVLDPGGGLGVGRAAVRRVVLETAVTGRVVRGGHHHAVGQTGGAAPVVGEDRQGDRGGRGVAVAGVEHDAYAVGGEHLDRRDPGGLGERVGVDAQEQRAVHALGGAVFADGLAGGQDVILVEGGGERASPVSRGAERHPLS